MIHPELLAFIKKFHVIPESLILQSGIQIERKVLKAGEYLLKPGDCSGRAGLVVSGLLRQFYLEHQGKEFTKYFQVPGVVAIAFAEAIQKVPSRVFIQAVVDSEVIIMSHPQFIDLFDVDLESQILARRIAEKYFVEKDQREWEFLHLPAEGRYDAFIQKFGAVADLIPQQHIASYIRVTPVSLSRMLAKRKRREPVNA